MSVPFDRIFSSTPLNKTAGSVTSKGEAYEPNLKEMQPFWDAPPPTIKPPEGTHDFTGVTFGRLTVLGYMHRRAAGNGQQVWAVRCVCGTYEARRAKAIRAADPEAMCQFCRHTHNLRRLGSKPRSVESFLADNGIKAGDAS